MKTGLLKALHSDDIRKQYMIYHKYNDLKDEKKNEKEV